MYSELDGDDMVEYQKAMYYIYTLMADGDLKIGDKLPTERALANKLDVGRNSVREAMSIMRGMGIIESIQGSGNYVSNNVGASLRQLMLILLALNTVDNKEVSEFRRVMEKAVCTALIRKKVRDDRRQRIEELLNLVDKLEQEIVEAETQETRSEKLLKLVEYDQQFHYELIDSTENTLVRTIMDSVTKVYGKQIDYVICYVDNDTLHRIVKCHRQIYNSIINGDVNKMLQEIDEHYDIVDELL